MNDDAANEHRLPDDVDRWPVDPHALLGVTQGISRRDLKRAYTRLIKIYKPEHAPEQFRRLREAYEQLERAVEWRERWKGVRADDDAASNSSDDESDEQPVIIRVMTNLTDAEQDRLAHTQTPDSDALWQQALDGGNLRTVYDGLVERTRQTTPDEVDFARLYWLLTVAWELDPDRDPCSWLISGLQQAGGAGRMGEMLDTEVRRRGGQVPLMLRDDLLTGREQTYALVNVLDIRWFAARRQHQFDVISNDLLSMKRRLFDEPGHWLRLLNIGVNHVVLTDADNLLRLLRVELDQVPPSFQDNWVWDSLDTSLALHDAWVRGPGLMFDPPYGLPPLFQDILDLVAATWNQTPQESRRAVLLLCQKLNEDSREKMLSKLSRIQQKAAPVLKQLLVVFDQQLDASDSEMYDDLLPGPDSDLERFVRRHFDKCKQSSFAATVLAFCLDQAVTPYELRETLNRMCRATYVPDDYFTAADELVGNLALNAMIKANRLLW